MGTTPTAEEVQRVRRHECAIRGHSWSHINVLGNEAPIALLCDNCGKRVPVGPASIPDRLLNYLHERRDAADKAAKRNADKGPAISGILSATAGAFDDVIRWLAAEGISR